MNSTTYKGEVIDASGWKGNAKWIKAIELTQEPINDEHITVFIDSKNKGGFSWIVPLPDRTLVGALSYDNPQLFLPKLNKKVLDVHGGSIPRVKPKKTEIKAIGDRTGLIKTFTGGGIFGIAELLNAKDYDEIFNKLAKEIKRQYYLTTFVEKSWNLWIKIAKLLNDKTLHVEKEFDFHSLLLVPH